MVRPARSASSGCHSCAPTGMRILTIPLSRSVMPRSLTVTSTSETVVVWSSRRLLIAFISLLRRRAGCPWAPHPLAQPVPARRRHQRISPRSLENRCTCSTAHRRWTTAPWAISSRAWPLPALGAASMSLTDLFLRCFRCVLSSTSVSRMRRSARLTCPAVVLSSSTRKA